MSRDHANPLEPAVAGRSCSVAGPAEQAEEAEPDAGLDTPEELQRRRDLLEAIAAAKEGIARRAAAGQGWRPAGK